VSRTRARYAPFLLGTGLLTIAAVLAVFTVAALALGEAWHGFAVATAVGGLVGWLVRRLGRAHAEPARREALIAVLSMWLLVPALGAVPFAIAGPLGPLDALFESMSGFTTTGATVFTDFTAAGRALMLWRALTQWVGGIGIIVLFIAVFPQLGIAGRQLFFTEAPGPTEDRLLPRVRNTAGAILSVYVGLTLACLVGYLLVGMTGFEATAHALTTLAAGGFSPSAHSFEAYGPGASWVAIGGMLFAGANFALLYRLFVGRPSDLLRDPEFRTYVAVLLIASVVLGALLSSSYPLADAVRHAAFQSFSIMTSTGYASADFAAWSTQAQGILVALMLIGGSAGSAAGGVKVVRWLILAGHTSREVRRVLHPRAVLPLRLGKRLVPEEVTRAVAAFITVYVVLTAFSTLVLVLVGKDPVTAFTATVACLGNIGPGLGTVGPMLSFADLHPVAKALLIFDMYAGRLEVVTVFVVFTRGWWRLPRRGRGWGVAGG
jgi:trk system potassium uptake protein